MTRDLSLSSTASLGRDDCTKQEPRIRNSNLENLDAMMKSDRKEGCWGRYHVACSWSDKRTNRFVNWRRKSPKSHGHRHFRWTSLCLAPSLFGNTLEIDLNHEREKEKKTSGFIPWRDNERIVASAFGSAFSGCRKLSNFFPLFFLYFLLKRKIHFYFIFCGNRFNQLKWILFYRLKFYSFFP